MTRKKQVNRVPKKPKLAQQVRVLTPEEIQVLLNWDMTGIPHFSAAELIGEQKANCRARRKRTRTG